jgi:hypothetical protein
MRHAKWGLLGLLGLMVVGCAQKLTYDRWEMVNQGQSKEGVEAILGKPVERLDMRWMYMDADRGITADIYFDDAKVIGKTWADPKRGMCGQSPNVTKPGDAETHSFQKIK